MVTPNLQLLADTHVSHRLVTSNLQLLADTHVSHRLVTPNIQLLADTHVSYRLVTQILQLLADTHVSHRLVTQIFSYWLIHMSAIAWLPPCEPSLQMVTSNFQLLRYNIQVLADTHVSHRSN